MRLLVGIDRSERAKAVLGAATARATDTGDELTVAVVETADGSSIDQLKREVQEHLSARSIDADVQSFTGHAGSQLVEFAEQEGFDRLVIDGGQRSPLGKIQLEDVAEFVLLNATMTVTLVR